MKAATQKTYGFPDVLSIAHVESPSVGDHDVLVKVHASPVTQGDRRLRAADYPGATWLAGRMVSGLFRPRNEVGGTNFAGRVVAVGGAVTRFTVGDDVFGTCPHGAYAEYLAVSENSAIAQMPSVTYAEAAALPYGAVTALIFLRDLGEVGARQRVLIVGASGGVGQYAVQIARHLGAHVTAVCRGGDAEFVRQLGADEVIDYTTEDFTTNGQTYDVIFDTSATARFARCRASLTPEGRFVSVDIRVRLLLHMLSAKVTGGPRPMFTVSQAKREDLEQMRELVDSGAVRPVIDRIYSLDEIRHAHARVESKDARGTVVVAIAPTAPVRVAA